MSGCDDKCRENGYQHGLKGLFSMRSLCPDWSEGWKQGAADRELYGRGDAVHDPGAAEVPS